MTILRHARSLQLLVACIAIAVSGNAFLHAGSVSDSTLASISFEQNLNRQVSLDLPFVDESGQAVRLGQYFGRKPVILVMGYYECPMLCSLVMNGMVEGLEDVKWSIGKEFEIINVSINPQETATLAAAKKNNYLKRYGRAEAAAGWHFLTGQEQQSRKLADEVGFRYVYDPVSKQYAHPSGLVVLTPQGKISGYLFGVTFAPKQLYASLQTASVQKISSPIQKLVLLCFHYNPITGRYGPLIMTIIRVMAVATIAGLALLVGFGVRRSRQGRGPQDLRPTLPGSPAKTASTDKSA